MRNIAFAVGPSRRAGARFAARQLLAGVALSGLLAAAAALAAAKDAGPCGPRHCEGFDWQSVADGVYAAVRREPPGLLEHSNSLVIVNEADVVVVDSQMTVAATRELIRAIRKVTAKPVRYVINTHWHDDHVFGNAAYAAAFPGVDFISSATTREELSSVGQSNRDQFVKSLPGEMGLLRHHLSSGTALDWKDLRREGEPLTEQTRFSLLSDLAQATDYLGAAPKTPVVLPTVTFDAELNLTRGSREIRLFKVGPAHTGGDVVVWLPAERVLAAGDAVSAIVPMAAPSADLRRWSASLDRLLALNPRVLVPGHGQVQTGVELLRSTKALLGAVIDRTTAAYVPGASLEAVQRDVHLEDYREKWAGTDPVRLLLFTMFFEAPAVASVYQRIAEPEAPCPPAPAAEPTASNSCREHAR